MLCTLGACPICIRSWFVIAGKKYTLLDGVTLLCMSVGLILFTLADSSVQPNFDQTGECWSIDSFTLISCIGFLDETASASLVPRPVPSFMMFLWLTLKNWEWALGRRG